MLVDWKVISIFAHMFEQEIKSTRVSAKSISRRLLTGWDNSSGWNTMRFCSLPSRVLSRGTHLPLTIRVFFVNREWRWFL